MKNCIRSHYEKLKPLQSGFIENSNFENNRDPCHVVLALVLIFLGEFSLNLKWSIVADMAETSASSEFLSLLRISEFFCFI